MLNSQSRHEDEIRLVTLPRDPVFPRRFGLVVGEKGLDGRVDGESGDGAELEGSVEDAADDAMRGCGVSVWC